MALPQCINCDHAYPHNRWGRCSADGCDCMDFELNLDTMFPEQPDAADGTPAAPVEALAAEQVMVIRDPVTEAPLAIPADIVAENDRVYRAFRLHQQGHSWARIAAAEEGWESPQAVAATVRTYLDRGKVVWGEFTANEMLAIKIAQMDTLLEGIWSKATGGTIGHVNAARKIITDQVKMAGWGHEATKDEPERGDETTVVFIQKADGDYTSNLRMVVDNTSRAGHTDAEDTGT